MYLDTRNNLRNELGKKKKQPLCNVTSRKAVLRRGNETREMTCKFTVSAK